MTGNFRRRLLRAGLGALGLQLAAPARALAPQAVEDDAFTGLPGTRVRFAPEDTARSLLMAEDEWLAATGDFQRRAVMQRDTPVDPAAFRRWNGEAARAWLPEQRQRWRQVLAALAPAFTALRIPLPPEVWLVASNGQESANHPYTRGNAVVLPHPMPALGVPDALLMAHELWHVAARHAPALATRLYAELGFEPMPELEFPAAWADIRIANPDAPANRHAMPLVLAERRTRVTPVLVAARTTLRPGETFFDVMDVRLLEVAHDAGAPRSQAVLRDGQPLWHPVNKTPGYLQALGGNTGYVIHHEEALADNIALLATQARVRNPALLQRLRAVLEGPR
ncbi:MAG: hypothetical protein HY855_08160 [Burkholderiales bacterium]|nr:hypothetical protein [Burkholderiales bacterium]